MQPKSTQQNNEPPMNQSAPKNSLTYEIKYLKREIEGQKALIKNLKDEAKKEISDP